MNRPGRDRIGPFQLFPASSQNTFVLDACRSSPPPWLAAAGAARLSHLDNQDV